VAPNPRSNRGPKKPIIGAQPGQASVPMISVNKIGKQFYVNIKIFDKNIRFLVDTGSQLNIICKKNVPKNKKIEKTKVEVMNYSGGRIEIFGKVEAKIYIDETCWGKSEFFIVSDELSPILGVPALVDNEILINLKRMKLVQSGPIERFCNLNRIEVLAEKPEGVTFKAYSQSTITFRPKTEMLVDLLVPEIKFTQNLFFEESNLGECKLQIIPSFQVVEKETKIFRVLVINPSESSIKIPAGTVFVVLNEIFEIAKIKENLNFNRLNNITVGKITSTKIKNEFYALVNKYSYLFLENDDPLPACSIDKFSILTDSPQPISTHPYRTPFSVRNELRSILDEFLENKLIEPCSSPWNSPSLLVRKKDGRFRLVIDYRRLNDATLQMHHPLPNLEDSISYLEKSRVFSMCDMIKGFHQIDLDEDSKEKTAFSNEFGQFRYLRMPMGCKNAPSFFMRIMDKALLDVKKTEIIAYMDDLLCHSQTEEEHIKILDKLFQILAVNNLRINSKKAAFFTDSVNFCGYDISNGKICPSKDKIEAIQKLKIPRTKDEAQSLFGALNYHRRFIRGFAELALPISKTYRSSFAWTEQATEALEILKDKICENAMRLRIPPADEANFVIETDASDKGYGGVLYICEKDFGSESHCHNSDCLVPVCYNSGNFSQVQQNYTIVEKELLSGKLCMEKWAMYLAFKKFEWITDNSNIKYVRTLRTNNQKIARWLTDLQSFSFKISQRPSSKMKISDFLSRHDKNSINQIKLCEGNFSEIQKMDETLGEIFKFIRIDRWPNNPKGDILFYCAFREQLKILESGELVLVDQNITRICVPKNSENVIIAEYHNYCHTGIDQTFSKISKKYVWPRMNMAIREFIRTCDFCQKDKPNFHPNRAPVLSFRTPSGPYEVYGFDLITLPPTDFGNKYVMVMIDFFSKFAYCEPLKSRNSDYLLSKFRNVIFKNPFFPRMVVLDNAREHSKLAEFMKENKIEPHFTPPRHPSSNGQVENFNRTLKSRLRAKCKYENWDLILQEVLHDINASEHSVTQKSPFFIQSGAECPHNIFDPNYRNYNLDRKTKFAEIQKLIEDEKEKRISKFSNPKFHAYNLGDLVLVKNFDSKKPAFLGPFKITSKSTAGTWYTVESNNKTFRRHADHLKIYNSRKNIDCRHNISASKNSDRFPSESPNIIVSPTYQTIDCSGSYSVNESQSNIFENNEEIENKLDEFVVEMTKKVSSKIFYEWVFSTADSITDSDSSMNSSSSSDENSTISVIEKFEKEQIGEIENENSQMEISLGNSTANNGYELNNSDEEYEFETNSNFEITIDSESEPETIINSELAEQPKLISYDKLDITENRKREREPSDNPMQASKIQNLENSPKTPSSSPKIKRTNLLIKFENDDKKFFDRLDEKFKVINADHELEKGCILKLGELTKETLQYVCSRFRIDNMEDDKVSELRIKIREYISNNHPDWRKSTSGEFLFFSVLNFDEKKTLYDMSRTELKVLTSQFELPIQIQSKNKSEIISCIDKIFSVLHPNHPRKNNDLIFGPVTINSP